MHDDLADFDANISTLMHTLFEGIIKDFIKEIIPRFLKAMGLGVPCLTEVNVLLQSLRGTYLEWL